MEGVTTQFFFAEHAPAIEKVSNGEKLFESEDNDVASLRECVEESWLPLPSATQLVESKVKDATFCKTTGKDESHASTLAMVRSATAPEITEAVKENSMLKVRKRKNEDAKDWLHGRVCNEELLTCAYRRHEELMDVPVEEIECCRSTLDSEHHFKINRQTITIEKFLQIKDDKKEKML